MHPKTAFDRINYNDSPIEGGPIVRVESTVRVLTVVSFRQSEPSRVHDAVDQNVTLRRPTPFASFG